MSRPKKEGVDYFSHDVNATNGRTIFTLESKYGNDGYAFWFKLLEILGSQNNLCYDCNSSADWLYLVAKTKVSESMATDILETLSQIDAIDKELWHQKVIWVQKFSERLSDVYSKRGTETPIKPSFCDGNTGRSEVSVTESTQSKVKESKVKDSKGKDTDYTLIVGYLNLKTGATYKSTTGKTRDCIKARINEGFTIDDFYKVIDTKCNEWLHDEKMQKYLRPETLFSNKFEGYLNQGSSKSYTGPTKTEGGTYKL